MKKVWLISPYIAVDKRSTRQAIIARYLEKIGYQAIVITTCTDQRYYKIDKPYALVDKNDTKYLIIKENVTSVEGIKRVYAQLKFQQKVFKYGHVLGEPDIIIGNFAGLFGDVVFKYKKRFGTKVMLDILDFWPEVLIEIGHLKADSLITRFLYYLEHRAYKRADSIFSSIVGFKDYITDKGWDSQHGGGVNLNKIHYINNGVEINEVDNDREMYIIEDPDLDRTDVFKIGYIGSIGVPNHLDMVVEAAKLADIQGYNDILFLIYGSGGKLDSVKKLSEQYNLHNISFKGFLDKRFFASTINRCNVALLNFEDTPSLKYGMSNNKFFMYCASGLPVLCTVHPGYSVIDKRKCGLIVENTPAGLLNGVLRFQKMSKDEYAEYKKNARIVGEDYDYNKMLVQLKNEVIRLIGE